MKAKLGEKNKFYYDENLKRWVEEGAEPPAEETALPPPPTTAAFQNGLTDYNLKSALKTEGPLSKEKTSNPELTPGFPPIPPSTSHFSSRGRVGIRSSWKLACKVVVNVQTLYSGPHKFLRNLNLLILDFHD
ncbi:COPII coat assembly protein SEC16-like, partial [Trifolium medium]|nr:COPII coat assembly protein SEC16-like [Trifolium medium]